MPATMSKKAQRRARRARRPEETTYGDMSRLEDRSAHEPWEEAAAVEEVERELAALGLKLPDHPPCTFFLGFTPTWGAEIVRYTPKDGRPCPACGVGGTSDRVIPRGAQCVVCSASWADPSQRPHQAPLRGRVRARARSRRLKGGVGA